MRLGLLVMLGLAGAGTADASTRVLRFTRSTSLPPAWQQLPDRITTSIAAETDAKPSTESLVTLDCDGTDDCLDNIAKQLDATELVFGTIRSGDDPATKLVTITRFAPGGYRAERTFKIVLEDAGAPRALVLEALPFLEKPLQDGPLDEDSESDARDDDQRDDKRGKRDKRNKRGKRDEEREGVWLPPTAPGRISNTTYAVLAGGGLGVAIGVGFSLQAWSLRNEVARAPVDTSQDLRRLAMLEARGQTFTTTGVAFTVAGSAIIVYGAVRAIREKRTRRPIDVALVPMQDGAAFVVGGSWR
jgi:hypothetical protein